MVVFIFIHYYFGLAAVNLIDFDSPRATFSTDRKPKLSIPDTMLTTEKR